MKPAMKSPGVEPWRTNSFADGTALGIVPGYTELPTLDICAAVVDACATRGTHSPEFGNYFADPLCRSGMVRAVQPGQTEGRKVTPFELEGMIEIDGFGNARLR
jgi:hypothetical protein